MLRTRSLINHCLPNNYTGHSSAPSPRDGRVLFLLMLFVSLWPAAVTHAQDIKNPQDAIDYRSRSDAKIDPGSLGMQLQIPLGNYSERGGTSLPVTLYYSSKLWTIQHQGTILTNGYPGSGEYDSTYTAEYAKSSASGWTSSLDYFRWPSATGRYFNAVEQPPTFYDMQGNPCKNQCARTVTRMMAVLPDGSRHELRRDDYIYDRSTNPNVTTGTFYSVDGSHLRYETSTGAGIGTLYLPDGSRYVLDSQNQAPVQYIDRNGNMLTYTSATGQWTDSRGRPLSLPPLSPVAGESYYSLPGVNASSITYTLRWRNLADVCTDSSQPLRYKGDSTQAYPHQPLSPSLFQTMDTQNSVVGGISSSSPVFNPVVLSEIELPTGQKYIFTYNVYGEIDKIVYPTGGYETFNYGAVQTLSSQMSDDPLYTQANRGVMSRSVSAKGDGTDAAVWSYGTGVDTSSIPYKLTRTITAPDGSSTQLLFFDGKASGLNYGFDDVRNGKVYDERSYSSTGQMMHRKLTEWTVTSVGVVGSIVATRNPRATKEVEIVFDPAGGNALAKTVTMQYDGDQNVTSTTESAYAEVDPSTAQTGGLNTQGQITIPAGATVRTSETDYALSGNGAYRARQLIALPTETRLKDASGNVVARTQMLYDEGGAYQTLSDYGSGVTGWKDPETNVRGLVTTIRRWLNTTNTYLETHAQYDQAGNVRNSWDALGRQSSVDYSSDYQYAYPTSTKSAIPNPGGVQGSKEALTTSTTYDSRTGAVTSTTDANKQTTSYEYAATDSVGNANPLGRLTKVLRPTGGGWTSYEYGRNQYGDYVGVRTAQDASTTLQSYQFFDGLGRPYRSFQNDPADSSAQWLTVDTQYDALGRAKKVSNPYRSSGWADTDNASRVWTTNGYDALGRVTSITTPDNAVVSTQYTGNSVLVTDQAGKQRKSFTDSLGRLTQVVEAPKDASFNYPTNYTYDVLGNLRKVEQGQQTRFFMYDSLSRLIRAKNPEQAANGSITGTDPVTNNSQWSMSYGYDDNGNLQIRTDARGTVANYVYDNLNRATTIYYSDSTSAIQNFYDFATNGLGRVWQQRVDNTNVEIPAYDNVGRATVRHEMEWAGAFWREYYVNYGYDWASHVTSMTYPSGHTVNYSYDATGRAQSFTGYLGDGVQRSYASNIQYDEASRLKQEQYGTNTPLYHKQHYNIRGQLYDVRLSTQSFATDQWNWDRGGFRNCYDASCQWGASDANNNGNLRGSESAVPLDANAVYTAGNNGAYASSIQTYDYDALNRLKWVSEQKSAGGGSQFAFKQAYAYDQWGNRTIDQTNTTDQTNVAPEARINTLAFAVNANNNQLGVPAGQSGAMSYDNAGNLTTDTYTAAGTTGAGGRSYDAENRMTRTTDVNGNQVSQYEYDAEGKRVKRIAQGQEVWMVYGLGGELLAEYASSGTAVPKEYGYRSGQLLITASPTLDAQAQSNVIVHLYQTILNRRPSQTEVQGWLNQGLTSVEAFKSVARQIFGSQEYLNRQRTDHEFVYDCYEAYLYREPDQGGWDFWTGLVPSQGRDNVRENGFAGSQEFADRVASTLAGETLWLTADQLGTPRIISDASGSLANVKRHDYLPFGEEVGTGIGGRTTGQGYNGDSVRQKFAGSERDDETGLDYMQARYFSSPQGRFTSVDPLPASMKFNNPQTLNRYTYALNNPLRFTDPNGEDPTVRTITRQYEFTLDDRNERGDLIHQANISVTEITREIVDDNGTVMAMAPPKATVEVTNSGNGAQNFSDAQRNTIGGVVKDIVEVSREKGVSPQAALAIGIEESKLGIGAVVKENKGIPEKQPDVNPMQLSGRRENANRRHNVQGAIDDFIAKSSHGRRSLRETAQAYRSGSSGPAYGKRVEGYANTIWSQSNPLRQTVIERPLQ